MIATIDQGEVVELNIDILREYYDKTKAYLVVVRKVILEEKDES